MTQNSLATITELSDPSLVNLARDGDDQAFSILWERHHSVAVSAARSISSHDPEDMAAEAFARILQAIRNGAGPQEGFRAYLYATLRSISMAWSGKAPNTTDIDDHLEILPDGTDLEEDSANRSLTVTAFSALPAEWRTVLWYTEVEGMTPAEAAPLLGMTAGAVAALSFRARNGLRESWLQVHAGQPLPDASDECRWAQGHFASYLRDSLSARRTERLQDHLVACFPCSTSFASLADVNRNLRAFLLPLVLGVPAAALEASGFLAVPVLGGAVPASAQGGQLSKNWSTNTKAIAAGAGVGAVILTAIGVSMAMSSTPAPSAAPEPSHTPSQVFTPAPPQTPAPQPPQPTQTAVEQPPAQETSTAPAPTLPPPPKPAAPARPTSPPQVTAPPLATEIPQPPAVVVPSPSPTTPEPEPTEPKVEPTVPPVEPTVPPVKPTEPPVKPTAPPVKPTVPPVKPTEPPVEPTEPPEVVDPVADLAVLPVDHAPHLMPQLSGTGEPGALVQVLTSGPGPQATGGDTTMVDQDGQWTLNIPSVTVADPSDTFTFSVLQTVTDVDGVATSYPSVPVLQHNGSTQFSFVTPYWSHLSTPGQPDNVLNGGTVTKNRNSNSSPIRFYFRGEPGQDIAVFINGEAPSAGSPHRDNGGNMHSPTWTPSGGWTSVGSGVQTLDLSYSSGLPTDESWRQGAKTRFTFNLILE